ncbi:hypothetical protein C943_01603 [Mariniradius saccharolyticus AK6]|uniref:Uncharacterized protein n=1 Tax=Mariniradius saccharolyticus AK6 TaxID=1239962 RepID=M7XBQ0_9BACT|nr:hypothetical protein C943_01603 [Mariniradius saccharolyticus AK6]
MNFSKFRIPGKYSSIDIQSNETQNWINLLNRQIDISLSLFQENY